MKTKTLKQFILLLLFLCVCGCGKEPEPELIVLDDTTISEASVIEPAQEPEKYLMWINNDNVTCDLERIVANTNAAQGTTYGDILDEIYENEQGAYVDLTNYQFSFKEEAEIMMLFSEKNLSYHFMIPIGDDFIDSELSEISVSEINLTEIEGFDVETFFLMMPNLSRIEMCNCGFTNEEMANICDAHEDIRVIWEVHLEHWTFRTDIVAFTSDKTCADDFFMENEDAQYLKYCTDLLALDLGHNHVNDFSFLNELTNLRVLIVVDNVLYERPDQSLHHIESYCLEPLYNLTEMRYLEIFSNAVTDIGFINNMPKLMDVNISYNPIYDISPLFNHPRLRRIWLEHINASESQIASLRAAYPGAIIVSEGEGSIDQGWRENEDYYAMRRMFHNNEAESIFMQD